MLIPATRPDEDLGEARRQAPAQEVDARRAEAARAIDAELESPRRTGVEATLRVEVVKGMAEAQAGTERKALTLEERIQKAQVDESRAYAKRLAEFEARRNREASGPSTGGRHGAAGHADGMGTGGSKSKNKAGRGGH